MRKKRMQFGYVPKEDKPIIKKMKPGVFVLYQNEEGKVQGTNPYLGFVVSDVLFGDLYGTYFNIFWFFSKKVEKYYWESGCLSVIEK